MRGPPTMRVLVLSQLFPPEPISKPMEVARGMAARGHEVQVLTGLPNYPTGSLYPGYRMRLLQREIMEGLPVLRVILYPSHSTSALGRMVNFGSFMLSAVIGAFFTGPCDVIYVRHPPLTIGVASWLIGIIKGAPVVYDVQDIWPESGVWSGMLKPGLLVRLLHMLEKFVYRRADHMLVVTEGARQNLIGKGVPPEKVSVASQLLDEAVFSAPDMERVRDIRERYALKDRFVVLFAGNMGLVQGLESAVEAASLLTDLPQVTFLFVGDGVAREPLERKAAALGLNNVVFAGRHPEGDMPSFMAVADATLLSLRYSQMCEFSIPLKTFAYLASSRPIIAAIKGAAADLVARAEAGPVIAPEDAQALASAVRAMAALTPEQRRAFGDAGRRYMAAHHAKEAMLDEYARTIKDVAHRG